MRSYATAVFSFDTRSLSLFRIAVGAIIAGGTVIRLQELTDHYSEAGVLPFEAMYLEWAGKPLWTLYALSAHEAWAGFLLLATLICSLLFALGVAWRPMGIALWVLLVSLWNRNGPVMNSGDTLLIFLVLWGLFLPLGRHFCLRFSRKQASDLPALSVTGAGGAALVLQVLFLYTFGALHKTGEAWRVDFLAVQWSLEVQSFIKPIGSWLLSYPELCRPLTAGIFWTELLFPVLLFLPWGNAWFRLLLTGYSFALHIGLGLCLYLGLFPWVCCALGASLLPPMFWNYLGTLRFKSVRELIPRFSTDAYTFPRSSEALATLMIIYVSMSNLQSLPPPNGKLFTKLGDALPPALQPAWKTSARVSSDLGYVLRLHQRWRMFSPNPPRYEYWIVISAELINGETIDLIPDLRHLRAKHPVSIAKPTARMGHMHTARWRKYFSTVLFKQKEEFYPYLAGHLVQKWNANHPFEDQINYLRITTYSRLLPSLHDGSEDTERVLFEQSYP